MTWLDIAISYGHRTEVCVVVHMIMADDQEIYVYKWMRTSVHGSGRYLLIYRICIIYIGKLNNTLVAYYGDFSLQASTAVFCFDREHLRHNI